MGMTIPGKVICHMQNSTWCKKYYDKGTQKVVKGGIKRYIPKKISLRLDRTVGRAHSGWRFSCTLAEKNYFP